MERLRTSIFRLVARTTDWFGNATLFNVACDFSYSVVSVKAVQSCRSSLDLNLLRLIAVGISIIVGITRHLITPYFETCLIHAIIFGLCGLFTLVEVEYYYA